MKPFTLPDFYTSHPARLNPHYEYARVHSAAWAQRMGMLGELGVDGKPIWDAEKLDRMGYALLCAYTHPDCDAETLALLTEWYIWVFYFDDWFLSEYKSTGDRGAATGYLRRLELFMGEPGCPAPQPETPSEAGLADCWARTIPVMSAGWRRRMRTSTHNLMVESLWELDNIARDRYLTQSFLGCSRERAADIVVDLANERLRQFEFIVRDQLPGFFTDHRLPESVRVAAVTHVERLRHHMAGNLHWHTLTGRYAESTLRASVRKPVIGGPRGAFVSVLADRAGRR